MNDCVFCHIVKGEAPAEIVNECEGAITIVPRDPVTKGHLLVIPRQHAEYLWNLHPQHLAHTAFEVASQAYDAWDNAGGVNVIQSNGSPATQTVWHVHFHIVPRYAMDGLKLPWSGGQHMHPGFTETVGAQGIEASRTYRLLYEQSSSPPVVLIHLVMDEDRDRTACTGELWRPPPDDYYPKVPRQLCEACRKAGTR